VLNASIQATSLNKDIEKKSLLILNSHLMLEHIGLEDYEK